MGPLHRRVRECGHGWMLPIAILNQALLNRGIVLERVGERDNVTDGEWHRIYRNDAGNVFECHANLWDAATFIPLAMWADDD